MDDRVLDIQHLTITHQDRPAVNDISFYIQRGEILGVVGESGCGKSLTALSLMGLLPKNMQVSGDISYQGRNLLENTSSQWQQLRGNRLAMIFQEPMTAPIPYSRLVSKLQKCIGFIKRQVPQMQNCMRLRCCRKCIF